MKKATTSIKTLAKAKVKFAKRNKTGTYTPVETKKEATHRIRETAGESAIAEPVKRGRKSFVHPETMTTTRRPKPPQGGARYGAPRYPDEIVKPETASLPLMDRSNIPDGATHLMYTSGETSIFASIKHLDDFAGHRGAIKFGRMRHNEDFVSMMPDDKGTVTQWKDGKTCFAAGDQKGSGTRTLNGTATPSAGTPKPPRKPLPPSRTPNRPTAPVPSSSSAPRSSTIYPRPKGGKTGRIWELADALKAKLKREPTKAELLEVSTKEGANVNMAGTQFGRWRKAQ